MSTYDGVAGLGDAGVVAAQAGMTKALADSCSGVLALHEANSVTGDSSLSSMWYDWLFDLQQIMNHRQVPIMINEIDEDLLSSMIALKGRASA